MTIEVPDWAKFQVGLTDHPIERDENVLRYVAKPLMRWLCDTVGLNQMWAAYQHGKFSQAEFMQFYRDIGYSLSGYEEIWAEALNRIMLERTRDDLAQGAARPRCMVCGTTEHHVDPHGNIVPNPKRKDNSQ